MSDPARPPRAASPPQNQKPAEDGGGPGTEEDARNATEKEVEIEKGLKAKLDQMGVEIVRKASPAPLGCRRRPVSQSC